jgi:DNA-directed RNA polymerase subunit RPC12/RpoP
MNNAPSLTKCSYCGRSMSSEFNKCPHCGKVVPRIVSCHICHKELRNIDAVNRYGGTPNDTVREHLHWDCLEQASTCFCSVCNRKITLEEILAPSPHRCPECGHISSITSCNSCYGYLLSKDAVNTNPI